MRLAIRPPAVGGTAARAIVRTGLVAGAALVGAVLFGLLADSAQADPGEAAQTAGPGLQTILPDRPGLLDEVLGTDRPADSPPADRVTEVVPEALELPEVAGVAEVPEVPETESATGVVDEIVETVAAPATEALASTATGPAGEALTDTVDTAESRIVEPIVEPVSESVDQLLDPVGGAVEQLVGGAAAAVDSTVDQVLSTAGSAPTGLAAMPAGPPQPPPTSEPGEPAVWPLPPTLPGTFPDHDLPAGGNLTGDLASANEAAVLALLPQLGLADPPPSPPAAATGRWMASSGTDHHRRPGAPTGPPSAPGTHSYTGSSNDKGPPVPWASPAALPSSADLEQGRQPEDVTGSGLVMSIVSPPG